MTISTKRRLRFRRRQKTFVCVFDKKITPKGILKIKRPFASRSNEIIVNRFFHYAPFSFFSRTCPPRRVKKQAASLFYKSKKQHAACFTALRLTYSDLLTRIYLLGFTCSDLLARIYLLVLLIYWPPNRAGADRKRLSHRDTRRSAYEWAVPQHRLD